MRIRSLVCHPDLFRPLFPVAKSGGQSSPTKDFTPNAKRHRNRRVRHTDNNIVYCVNGVPGVRKCCLFRIEQTLPVNFAGTAQCSVSRLTRISEVRSSNTLATAAATPIRPRLFLYPRYWAPAASRSSIASSIRQKSVTAFV